MAQGWCEGIGAACAKEVEYLDGENFLLSYERESSGHRLCAVPPDVSLVESSHPAGQKTRFADSRDKSIGTAAGGRSWYRTASTSLLRIQRTPRTRSLKMPEAHVLLTFPKLLRVLGKKQAATIF